MELNSIIRKYILLYLVLTCTTVSHADIDCSSSGDIFKIKAVTELGNLGVNLLSGTWLPWQSGYVQDGDIFICDNGTDTSVQRGLYQAVTLNQTEPQAVIATAWSKAENVRDPKNRDYSLYLDVIYDDDSVFYGRADAFDVGTHEWEKARVILRPDKPIKTLYFYMLFRNHAGRVLFRDPELKAVEGFDPNTALFDGVPVSFSAPIEEGFQVRDVARDSDFVAISNNGQGLSFDWRATDANDTTFYDVTVTDLTGRDRAITLVYSLPVSSVQSWLDDPRKYIATEPDSEYMNIQYFNIGANNGQLSRYPFGAVTTPSQGYALGIDLAYPAFFRTGYNSGTQELFLAYDIGLTPEKPQAHLRFCKFNFDPEWKFRSALAKYYEIFPEKFLCRIAEQGLWIAATNISTISDYQDFGFRFKEVDYETEWDDAHNILTFRYTQPNMIAMPMPSTWPSSFQGAVSYARRLAVETLPDWGKAIFNSTYHRENGKLAVDLVNFPWNHGAYWHSNGMPGLPGEFTEFKVKWNSQIIADKYGPGSIGDLDGEYLDGINGFGTLEFNYRRDHFAYCDTPLVFNDASQRIGIFLNLMLFEYTRAMAQDVHGMGKFMMGNGAPDRVCWVVPLLDVPGHEVRWHDNGIWNPMSDSDLLYRRALSKGKPYGFLMNSNWSNFSNALVEKYMQRSLAYGMFPSFYSDDAANNPYFEQPALYNRDRALFIKYIPICKTVAQAGWEPLTQASSSDPQVYVERFGDNYLTVFNDSTQSRTVTITVEQSPPGNSNELVNGATIVWNNNETSLTLAGETVAVIELQ